MFNGVLAPYLPVIGKVAAVCAVVFFLVWFATSFKRSGSRSVLDLFRMTWWAFQRGYLWWQRPVALFEMPSTIYAGLPRSGKTLAMTADAIRLMRRGVRVISNYRIVDRYTGQSSILVDSWLQIVAMAVEAKVFRIPTVLVLDEAHNCLNSRFFDKTPDWAIALLSQKGHMSFGIMGSVQSMGQAEIALRRVVDYVAVIRPLLEVPIFGRRLPIVRCQELPCALLGPQGELPPAANEEWLVVPWWGFAGYDTTELVAIQEWPQGEDSNALAKALLEVARTHGLVDRFDTMAGEVSPQVAADLHGDLVECLLMQRALAE